MLFCSRLCISLTQYIAYVLLSYIVRCTLSQFTQVKVTVKKTVNKEDKHSVVWTYNIWDGYPCRVFLTYVTKGKAGARVFLNSGLREVLLGRICSTWTYTFADSFMDFKRALRSTQGPHPWPSCSTGTIVRCWLSAGHATVASSAALHTPWSQWGLHTYSNPDNVAV